MDSIYENNLNNLFLSEGISKEGMIDESNESPPDYFTLPLAEVDVKNSKVKLSKNFGVIDEQITFITRSNEYYIKD